MLPVRGLKPFCRESKFCQLRLDAEGVVHAHFVDGVQVEFLSDRVRVVRGAVWGSRAPQYRPFQEFTLEQMGSDMRDRTEHIHRQMELARAREPLITYYTDYCECRVMDCLPPDFVCVFHPEVVTDCSLHFSRRHKYLKLSTNGYDSFIQLRERDLSREFADLVMHNVDAFRDLNPHVNTTALYEALFPFLLHAYTAMLKCWDMEAAPQQWRGHAHSAGRASARPSGSSSLQAPGTKSGVAGSVRSCPPRNSSRRSLSRVDLPSTATEDTDIFPLIVDDRRRPLRPQLPVRLPL